MRPEIQAFRDEIDELADLLQTLSVEDWRRETPFKRWTVWDVVAHLHWTDRQASLALSDPNAFAAATEAMRKAASQGASLIDYTRQQLADFAPRTLEARWREVGQELCAQIDTVEPKARIPWYGPSMGARMFTTARQMETWAHGQDIYDLLERPRDAHDRIENIVVIGVKTFGWTFVNRGLPVPDEIPHVVLTAPSGAVWSYNPERGDERVEGSAVDFCHVVTQGRNVVDTGLEVTGPIAARWMAIAQCFAGAASDPPAPGVRTG